MKTSLLFAIYLLTLPFGILAQKKRNTNAEKSEQTGLTIVGNAVLRPIKDAMNVAFDYKPMNAPIPQFEIHSYENKVITKEVLDNGGNIFLIMFNPVCEHCEDETRLLKENIFLFKKSKILLVAAPVQVDNLGYFENILKCSEYPSTITVSIDSAKIIDKLFTYNALPQINIYDGKSKRLIKTFEGFVPIDSLRSYIN